MLKFRLFLFQLLCFCTTAWSTEITVGSDNMPFPRLLDTPLSAVAAVSSGITAETASTPNNYCNPDCNYDGPTILINEVMTTPLEYNNSIYGQQCPTAARGGGEWVELYNPDTCNAIDISGYFFGNAVIDSPLCNGVPVRNIGGGFVFPAGTIIPPGGFCVLWGEFGEEMDEGLLLENGGMTVQVKLMDHFERFCIDAPGGRFWLPDTGGWFALYDNSGVPQDAIYWGIEGSDICADCTPCNPQMEDTFMGGLPSLDAFPAERKHRIRYKMDYLLHEGLTPKRIPDGGEWSYEVYTEHNSGDCNAGCTQRFSPDCDGTATITPSSTGDYSYQWNDSRAQTTPTATGLCEGIYCCTVTDNDTRMSRQFCVTVAQTVVSTEEQELSICEGESVDFYGDKLTESGVYTKTVKTETGCDKLVELTLTVYPKKEKQIDFTICENESYLFDGKQLNIAGSYIGKFKTIHGCDSIVTLRLTVNPINHTELNVVIKDDESYFFAGNELTESGIYIDKQKNIYNCDSIITLNLRVLPDVISPPGVFTPNDDGKNDYFEIPNLELYPKNSILIFNRWGNKVFEASPYLNDWDGSNYFGIYVGGDRLPAGTYFYILNLGDGTEVKKGYVFLNY